MTGTILAKRYGFYREFTVAGALAGTVRCAWLHSAPAENDATRVAVVPDGCVDLLWTEAGFMIAGPDRTAAFPPMRPGATILGLRFKPGIARHLLRCDLDALTGKVVAFDDLRPGGFNVHHDRLLAADGSMNRLQLLQGVFAAEMHDLPAMHHNAAALEAMCKRPPAEGIAAALGVTERTLRRISTAEFGYGPKTLARILRLQKLLGRIGERDSVLAELAAETGFADQAHMGRDVLSLTSLTPGEILRQMRS
ncbi:helix-turn-helix domain-containing protein [Shinella curvata]|uniref:Helix-turn-helix domain-containing protein n=1 Tax=Shinella curvata TaxID=1817964 RepID=A0ABT8X822_9HYPH|nr:helix-turn-helix domain-containing protein [Shinella curvata]MCJ8052189.1 helix-turn-helix domain-containing protein [Shinella curvata]MDO6119863.1 helix-turn-helix domain-containing protein [Shinella curvata]